MAARVRSPTEPDSAPMEISSLIKRPWKPIESRITSRTIVAEIVAGATGSIAVNTTCAVIASGSATSGRKAAKSVASSVGAVGLDHRQLLVAVGSRAAMAGNVLEDRQYAALAQALPRSRRQWRRPWRDHCRKRGRRPPDRRRRPARRRSAGSRHRCRARRDRRRSGAHPSRAAARPASRSRS